LDKLIGMLAQLLRVVVRKKRRRNTEPALAIDKSRTLQAESERGDLFLLERTRRAAVDDSDCRYGDAPTFAWIGTTFVVFL
jgi:hypothetical protein